MMMSRSGAVGAFLLAWIASLGAETRWMDVERSRVTVYVLASRVPGADGAAHVIEAPLAEGSVDDTETPHLALVIDVGQLRIVDPDRSEDARQDVRARLLGPEGLDQERFSRITYHSLTIDLIEPDRWLVHGELEMHGRFLPLDVDAVRQGDRFTGTTTLVPTDFGMLPMRVAGTEPSVGHQVRVDFDIVLEAP